MATERALRPFAAEPAGSARGVTGESSLPTTATAAGVVDTLRGEPAGITVGTGEPCHPRSDVPPPWITEPSAEEWLAWWGDCVPMGPIGPGVAAGCDLEAVWAEALSFCSLRCMVDRYLAGEEDWSSCHDYGAVAYAYVDANCNVVDALCAYTSEGGAASGTVWLKYTGPGDTSFHGYATTSEGMAHDLGGAMGGSHIATITNSDGSVVIYYAQEGQSAVDSNASVIESIQSVNQYFNSLDEREKKDYLGLLSFLEKWTDAELDDLLAQYPSKVPAGAATQMGAVDEDMLCAAALQESVDREEGEDEEEEGDEEDSTQPIDGGGGGFMDDPGCPFLVLC
ncbi:MAG: hypothetical protein ABMA64_28625 [Myxococcota bacterium]